MIAALYIDPRGPYPTMLGAAACWDETRDATRYEGPHAVIAHPPCGPWSRMRHLYEGAEHDAGVRAIAQVRAYGGVLEQPAHSKLFEACGVPRADVYAVDQCDWGHVARKTTWLYVVGVPRTVVLAGIAARPFPGAVPTHWCSGSRGKSSREGSPVPPGIKVCSAQQRRRTPPLFAAWLASLAHSVQHPAP